MTKHNNIFKWLGLGVIISLLKQSTIDNTTKKSQDERAEAQEKKYTDFLTKLYRYCPQAFKPEGMTVYDITSKLNNKEGYTNYSCNTISAMLIYILDCVIGRHEDEVAKRVKKILCEDLGVKNINREYKCNEKGIRTIYYSFITK